MAGDTEGTIRFAYSLEPPAGAVAAPPTLTALIGWRAVLKRLALLGQDPERYEGLGFGNLSARDGVDAFVVTASQTAGADGLSDEDLVRITHASPTRFWVDAVGHQPPSSETLTHAMIYAGDPGIAWVFHGHSPDIWQRHAELGLPAAPEAAPYGSPAMADAVARLLEDYRQRPLVFVTLGHRDGVFACGAGPEETGAAMVGVLARALGGAAPPEECP